MALQRTWNILYTIHCCHTRPAGATSEEFSPTYSTPSSSPSTRRRTQRCWQHCSPSAFLKRLHDTVHMVIWRETLRLLPLINIQFTPKQNTDGLVVELIKKRGTGSFPCQSLCRRKRISSKHFLKFSRRKNLIPTFTQTGHVSDEIEVTQTEIVEKALLLSGVYNDKKTETTTNSET